MKSINNITIFYTNICNLNCNHCYVSPTFGDKKIMDKELLENIIEISIKNKIKIIAITGGEPTLFIDKLEESLIKFNFHKTIVTISTNAYWANNLEETKNMILKMKSMGISRIEISTDQYHQQYVPINNIINCIKIGQDIGIDVMIIVCSEKPENEILTLTLISKHLNKRENLVFQYTSNFGNASKNNLCSKIPVCNFKGKSCYRILNPLIMYNKDIFACCGPPFTLGKDNPLYLGKFDNKNINKILNSMLINKTFLNIYNNGPVSLLKDKANLENKFTSSLCKICEEVLYKGEEERSIGK